MFSAFNQLFKSLFSALERFAKALDHIGRVAEITAEGYAKEAELENAATIKRLTAELDKA